MGSPLFPDLPFIKEEDEYVPSEEEIQKIVNTRGIFRYQWED